MKNVRGYVSRVNVYRFRDCVAVSFVGVSDGGQRDPVKVETLYLPRTVADELATVLRTAAGTIVSGLDFPPVEIAPFKEGD